MGDCNCRRERQLAVLKAYNDLIALYQTLPEELYDQREVARIIAERDEYVVKNEL